MDLASYSPEIICLRVPIVEYPQFELHADIEDRHWWFLGRRKIMERIVRRVLPPSRQTTVVDVGCGTGANIAALARDYCCVGIDTSPQAIRFAQGRFPNVRFLCGSAPAELGSIAADARMFLLMDVLEHVDDDCAFLSGLLAAASPGAHFLLTVPANPSLWTEHDVSFGHYRRYDISRLQRTWDGLPVTVRLLSHYNSRLYPIVKVVRAASRRRGHARGIAGTDFTMPVAPLNVLLDWILAGEAGVLVNALEGRRCQGFSSGVSLVALLRREPGRIVVRRKPENLPTDLHGQEARHEP